MVKHIILWKLKEELSEEEKKQVKTEIKAGLEGLQGKIPGLVSIQVQTERLGSSNADLMLDSLFTDEEALKVRPYAQIRMCLDFEQEEGSGV